MDPSERFGINLRNARTQARFSQEALSERCAVHRTEVSRLEHGGGAPRLGTIVKLAGALGVGVESLCAGMSWDAEGQRFRFEE